ncbi:hypothetical protein BDV97DRAFT_367565 [Delphinella strobiligena]|nr:hypothetical protein BDV97DRAFT_367565 [Delphinella strobiligena]
MTMVNIDPPRGRLPVPWLHTPLPGILLVSREIRQEALEVFYKHSRFIIDLDDEVVFGWGPRSALAKRPLGPMASHLARMKKLQLQVAFLEFPGFPDYKHVAFNIDLMNNSEFKFDAFAQEEDLEETLSVNYSLHKRYDGWDLQNTLRGAIKEFLDSDGYGGLTIGEIRHLKNLIDLWEGPGWGTHFPPVGEHRHMYKV